MTTTIELQLDDPERDARFLREVAVLWRSHKLSAKAGGASTLDRLADSIHYVQPEPMGKFAIVKAMRGSSRFIRTEKNQAFPWEQIGHARHQSHAWAWWRIAEDFGPFEVLHEGVQ